MGRPEMVYRLTRRSHDLFQAADLIQQLMCQAEVPIGALGILTGDHLELRGLHGDGEAPAEARDEAFLGHMKFLEVVAAVAVSDDGKPVASAQLMRTALEYARTFKIPVSSRKPAIKR